MLTLIIDIEEKLRIARLILESLFDWFEIPHACEKYISDSADQIMIAAFEDDKPIGFICLKETGKDTVEISVMGVLKEYHRKGVGKSLFKKAKEIALDKGYSFIQVKTLKYGISEDYDNTNMFYRALGFKEFELTDSVWGKDNPCQIYVMSL